MLSPAENLPSSPADAPGSLLTRLKRALPAGSVARAMVHGFMTVAGITLAAKAVSFFKDAFVAHQFGVSDELDAFGLAFGVQTFAVSLLSSSIPAAFLPAYSQMQVRRGVHRAERLALQSSVLHLLVLAVGAAILWTLGSPITALLAQGYAPWKQALSQQLMHSLLPFLLCFGMTHHLSMWLRGNKQFAMAAATPLLIPFTIIMMILLEGHPPTVNSLVRGTNIGAALHLVVLAIVVIRRLPSRPGWLRGCLRFYEPLNRQILASAGPFLIASLISCASPMIDQAMATHLGTGSVTVLGYSDKVCGIIIALTASAASESLFPFFSEAVARGDWAGLRRQLATIVKLITYISLPMVLLLCWQAPLVVRLLFERGHFTAEDTARVASVLRLAVLQVPFYIISLIFARVIVSLGARWFLSAAAVLAVVANISLNYAFMGPFGVPGIALSTAGVYLLASVVHFVFLTKKIGKLVDDTPAASPAP